MKMARSKKIYHRNDARAALASMKLSTRRILYLVLSQQEKDENGIIQFSNDRLYTITAKEYAELCGIDESVAYKQLKEGIGDIRSCLLKISESDVVPAENRVGKSMDRTIVFTAANYSIYSDGEGYVELKLDPIMAPYISNLSKNFTGQYLLSGLQLPDNNANRLYLLLREWISSGFSSYKEIKFDELKEKLLVSDVVTYELFNEFNKLFMKRSIKKLIETTEFTKIEMKITGRRNRKAYMVMISYEYDEQDAHKRAAALKRTESVSSIASDGRQSKRAIEMMAEVKKLTTN